MSDATKELQALVDSIPAPSGSDSLLLGLVHHVLGRYAGLLEHAKLHAEEDAKLGAAFDAWLAAPGPETTPKLYEALGEWTAAGRGKPVHGRAT